MPVDDAGLNALLGAYPALQHLSGERRADLRAESVSATAPAGAIVFEPADFCQRFPFLIAGSARVLKVGSMARDTLLYRLRPGEYCLLSSTGLLARWRFGARVVAESEIRAVLIPGSLFRAIVRETREVSHAVHVAVARRLEVVMDLVEQATYFRLDQRLAVLLTAAGRSVAVTHQDLADDLGASRENVSRVLEGFQNRGWVALGRRQIEILDPSALETFLDQEN